MLRASKPHLLFLITRFICCRILPECQTDLRVQFCRLKIKSISVSLTREVFRFQKCASELYLHHLSTVKSVAFIIQALSTSWLDALPGHICMTLVVASVACVNAGPRFYNAIYKFHQSVFIMQVSCGLVHFISVLIFIKFKEK